MTCIHEPAMNWPPPLEKVMIIGPLLQDESDLRHRMPQA